MDTKTAGGLLAITIASFLLVGCLEREEKITIHQDGSLNVEWKLSGDEGDLKEGLAVPKGLPWKVETWVEKKEEGESLHYLAKADFADLGAFSKAIDFSPEDLRIDQSLERRNVNQRTYYIFKRIYRGRDWWKFQRVEERTVDKKLLDKAGDRDKGFKSLNSEERSALARGLVDWEVGTVRLLVSDILGRAMVDSGMSMTDSGITPDLIARSLSELSAAYRSVLTEQLVIEVLSMEEKAGDEELARIEAELMDVERAVLSQHFSKVDIGKYLLNGRKKFGLSRDLDGESFKLIVNMPGKVILTNGELQNADTAYYEFSGTDLMKRDIRFEVVSVME